MSHSGHATCSGCGGAILPGPRITVPGLDGSWHLHCPEHAWMAVEREACAKIAEADTSFDMLQDFGMQSHSAQLRANIAEAIRNRSTK